MKKQFELKQWGLRMALPGILALATFGAACSSNNQSSVIEAPDLADSEDIFANTPPQQAPQPQTQPQVQAQAQPQESAEPAAAQDVIARVDGKDIKRSELIDEMNMLGRQMQGRVPPERLAQMQDEIAHQAMEQLIVKTLILNELEKSDVEVDALDIEEMIQEYSLRVPPGSTLQDQLEQIGMSEEEFRTNIERELRVMRLLESKVAEIDPTEDEVRAFYEENPEYFEVPESASAKHILISFNEEDDEATRAEKRGKIEAIKAQLAEGADFSELAGEHSACPSSQNGGDLGMFGRGQMVPSFDAAAFTQPIGEVGDVVETNFGYHLILVTDRQDGDVESFEDSKENITNYLAGQKRETGLRDYIESLREGAEVEILDQ